MTNKPVAWMELYFGEPNNLAWTNAELKDSGDIYKTIPLYTHPAKEHDLGISHAIGFDDGFKAGMQRAVEMNVVKTLTDEEIDELARQMGMHLNDYEIDPLGNSLNFARAILRKAQEK